MHCQTVATLIGAVLGATPLTDAAVGNEYWNNSEPRGELMRSLQDTRMLLEDGIAWPQISGHESWRGRRSTLANYSC
jgi:hypothetical protein